MTTRQLDPAQTTLFPVPIDPIVEHRKSKWNRQKAKKIYHCVACGHIIHKGDLYF